MVIGFHGIDFGIWTLSYICDSNKMMKFGGDCLSTTEKKSYVFFRLAFFCFILEI